VRDTNAAGQRKRCLLKLSASQPLGAALTSSNRRMLLSAS